MPSHLIAGPGLSPTPLGQIGQTEPHGLNNFMATRGSRRRRGRGGNRRGGRGAQPAAGEGMSLMT